MAAFDETEKLTDMKSFLDHYKTKTKENLTHTIIPSPDYNVYGAKFSIPDEKMDDFYKLHYDYVFKKKKKNYLTELQIRDPTGERVGPILVDFDFRYKPDVSERQHETAHVVDIVELYTRVIQKVLTFEDGDSFRVYVFHKNSVNQKEDVTKDGIHMVFTIGCDHAVQQIIRQEVLKEIDDILGELPLQNTYEEVLDEGITKGTTGWQVYGCRKPGNRRYELTNVFDYTFEDDMFSEPDELQTTMKEFNTYEVMYKVSARNTSHKKYPIQDEWKELHEELKRKKSRNSAGTTLEFTKGEGPRVILAKSLHNVGAIKSIEDVEDINRRIFDTLTLDERYVKEAHDYVMALPTLYYTDRNKWIQTGWALRNTDLRLLWTWILFSAQWERFEISNIQELITEWTTFEVGNGGLTLGTIIMWLQAEDKERYNEIKSKTIDALLDDSVSSIVVNDSRIVIPEFNIAEVVFEVFKETHRCVSVKNKVWYNQHNNMWSKLDGATSILVAVSRTLSRKYDERADHYSFQLRDLEKTGKDIDEVQFKRLKKMITLHSTVATNLRRTAFKSNVVKESASIFNKAYPHFYQELDTNPYLLGFKNGVIDFDGDHDDPEKRFANIRFRPTQPHDNISISCGYDYIEVDLENEEHKAIYDMINQFMKEVLPIESVREYVWEYLASSLVGVNIGQTFTILTGCGGNGKSMLQDLIIATFGDYYSAMDVALLTNRRQASGQASPQVAVLKGKRIVLANEPQKGDVLNDGIMKQFTGGDLITCRQMYSSDIIKFKPQFSLAIATNNMFDINSTDDGTWRRIRVVDFISKFRYDPEPTPENPHVYLRDDTLEGRIKKWNQVFMWMLVQKFRVTKGFINKCPEVEESSNRYRADQNIVMQFCDECVTPADEASCFGKTDVSSVVREWFAINYPDTKRPSLKEFHKLITSKCGKMKRNVWTGWSIAIPGTTNTFDEEYDSDE